MGIKALKIPEEIRKIQRDWPKGFKWMWKILAISQALSRRGRRGIQDPRGAMTADAGKMRGST